MFIVKHPSAGKKTQNYRMSQLMEGVAYSNKNKSNKMAIITGG